MTVPCRRMIDAGAIVIDIGANIEAHTMPLAAQVGPIGARATEPTGMLVSGGGSTSASIRHWQGESSRCKRC